MINLAIFFAIIITTLSQILLKKATLSKKIRNKYIFIVLAYILFVLVIIISYFILKHIELKYFSIILGIVYITVAISSYLIFKEEFNKNQIIGLFIIILGIIIFNLEGFL